MPAFALDLDPDGIRLLRAQDGGWVEIDVVLLDDPALPKRLRAMRARAEAMAEGRLETLIVIPPSQILYTQVPLADGLTRIDRAAVAAALDGLTACPVEEMVFDWHREGAVLFVAALDVNTLDEAETFAATYGFNPVRFTARPDPSAFPSEPDFGPTQWASSAPPAEEAVPVFSSSRRAVPPPEAETPAPATEAPTPVAEPTPTAPVVQAAAPAPPRTETAARAATEPAPRPPARQRPRAPVSPPPQLRRGAVAIAAAVLLGLGGLTWTALYLVSPKTPSGLPELAATPVPQPEESVAETRLAPRRTPPALPAEAGLPALPDAGEAVAALTQAMAERRSVALPAGAAPDPETEVGVLSSADMWQSPPPPLIEPATGTSDDLYLAAVDPDVALGDAFALAQPSEDHAALAEPPPPPDPDAVFELDERGFVVATPEGVTTPDGVVVTAGAPPRRPPLRPVTAVLVADREVALALAGKEPRPRPADLTQRMERAAFGGRTLAELAEIRPEPRPASAQQEAVADAAEETASASDLAVAVSRAPSYRPTDFAAIVAAAQQARAAAPETDTAVVAASAAAVAPVRPTIPSSASVARQATIEGAINLRRLNLIGVYGSASDRRALIRLPSGRYVKVKVGDRIDGGQIAAIGDNEIRYVKGGKNHMLKVPSS